MTHRRLASLQNKLVHTCVTQILLRTFPSSTYALFLCSLEHTAGLNPKGFRIFRPTTQYFTHQRCDSNLIWILEEGLTFSFARQVPLRDAGLPAASQVPPVGPPPAARASEQVSPAGPARTPFACVDLVARLQHWHDRPEHRGQPDGAGDADELRLLAARAGWLVGVLARLVNIMQVGSFLTSIASHVSSSTVWPDHQAGEATQRLQHHLPPTPRPPTDHDHGASGRSSFSARLSTAANNSISCGSSAVPAFHCAERTVKTEYGANRYSSSPGTFDLLTRFTCLQSWSGSIRIVVCCVRAPTSS